MPRYTQLLIAADTVRAADLPAWYAEHGWQIDGAPRVEAILDRELRVGSFATALTRWSRVRTRRSPGEPGGFLLFVVIDGDGEVEGDIRVPRLGRGDVFVVDSSAEFSLIVEDELTVLMIESRWKHLHTIDRTSRVVDTSAEEVRTLRRVLLSMAAPIIAATQAEIAAQLPHVRVAVEAMVSALLDQSDVARSGRASSAERELLRRAMNLIRASAQDRSFSVERLSRELNVSKPYIQRAFRQAGTTPLRYLTAMRSQYASNILRGRQVTSRAELETIAREAGFSGARTMREALRRIDTENAAPVRRLIA